MSPAKKAAPREQVTLEFPDNRLLAALGGPHQKHFARLEQVLHIRLAQRGNLIAIEGEREAKSRAGTILRALYARLEAGESVTQAEVDAELRFTDSTPAAAQGAVRTASGRTTRPRSPAQSAYLELMRAHPLVFGIGPAGTAR